MQLNQAVAQMALTRTKDVALAMELAESLGDQVRHIVPIVTFPAPWVRKRQKCAVKSAAWAIRYCDDAKLQIELYHSTKRLGVREAIAESKYLSDETRATLIEELRRAGNDEDLYRLVRRAETDHRAKFNDLLAKDESFGEDRFEFERSMRIAGVNAADYFRVYTRGVDVRSGWVMSSIIFGAYCSSNACTEFELNMVKAFAADDGESGPQDHFTIAELYAHLNDDDKLAVLSEILKRGVNSGLNRPLSKYMAQEMVKRLEKPTARFSSRVHEQVIFTQKAVEYLIDYPEWLSVCARHPLSEEMFERALAGAGLKVRCLLVAARSREVAERLLSVLEVQHAEQGLGLTYEECEILLKLCERSEDELDPLVMRTYNVADNLARKRYLCGAWEVQNRALHPEVSVLIAEIERQSPGVPMDLTDYINNSKISDEYKFAYVDHVPGAAWAAMKYSNMLDHIWERLNAASSDTAMALNVFAEQHGQALDKICSTVARLAGDVT